MCSDQWLLFLIMKVQLQKQTVIDAYSLSLHNLPLKIKWLPEYVKDWLLSPLIVLLFFKSLWPYIQDYTIQKQPYIQGKLGNHHSCQGKKTGSENTWEYFKFTSQADPLGIVAANKNRKPQQHKTKKLWGRRSFWFLEL